MFFKLPRLPGCRHALIVSLHYNYELTGHDRHTKEHSLDCQAQVQVQILRPNRFQGWTQSLDQV